MTQPLQKELETYKKALSTLLAHEGKHVVIFGDKIEGIFDSYEDALKIGYEKAGVKPFLVKKISSSEQIAYFTRDVVASCRP